jgi:hypothetical protein
MVIGGLNDPGYNIVAGFVRRYFGAPFGIEQTENAHFCIPVIPIILCIQTYTEFFDNFLDRLFKFCVGIDHLKSSFDLSRHSHPLEKWFGYEYRFPVFNYSGNCCRLSPKILLVIVKSFSIPLFHFGVCRKFSLTSSFIRAYFSTLF